MSKVTKPRRYVHDDPTTYVDFDDPSGFATGDEIVEPHAPPNVDRAVSDHEDEKIRPEPRRSGGGTGRRVIDPPTPKQIAFLRSLLVRWSELQDNDDPAGCADFAIGHFEKSKSWTKSGVSDLIDEQLRANEELAKSKPQTHRPNRYEGVCGSCGGDVAENAGRIEKRGAKWVVFHLDGQHATTSSAPTSDFTKHEVRSDPPDVPEGHYAIESTGHNDLAFCRVDRPTEGTYAGRTFVKLIVGGHPDANVPRAHVAGILARIVETGVDVARQRYGTAIGRCALCNRHLTDETSRKRGIGPECVKKI